MIICNINIKYKIIIITFGYSRQSKNDNIMPNQKMMWHLISLIFTKMLQLRNN